MSISFWVGIITAVLFFITMLCFAWDDGRMHEKEIKNSIWKYILFLLMGMITSVFCLVFVFAYFTNILEIINGVKNVLEQTPPELAADLYERGIFLTGGGALTLGLAKRINERLQIDVKIAEDPRECVIKGTASALTWIDNIDEEKNESMKAKQKQLEKKEKMRRR